METRNEKVDPFVYDNPVGWEIGTSTSRHLPPSLFLWEDYPGICDLILKTDERSVKSGVVGFLLVSGVSG